LNQYELSKNTQQSQEKELKQIKDVLNELETNYKFLMQQFQELKRNDHQQKEQQQISNNWQPAPGETISFEKLKEFINQSFYLYNADKTGMTDFASESIGGSIMFTRCTETYLDNSRWFTVFDVPITRITVSPRVVIQGSLLQPGNCWAFKGSKADLFIKLAAKITPSSFSLEHIPKELSLTGVIDSAPQNFSVYGYESKDDIRNDNRLVLGNYRYDNNSKYTLQFFSVQVRKKYTLIQN
jgi:SUN domain-containing protein 1/2